MMLPALRTTNISPGSRCVSTSGTTRLSEQAMNIANGAWRPFGRPLPGQPMDFGLEAQRAFDQSVH